VESAVTLTDNTSYRVVAASLSWIRFAMCGRFTLRTPATVLTQRLLFDLDIQDVPDDLAPRFNIAPTQSVAVVRELEEGERCFNWLRWGLIPSWAKDPAIGNRTINARAETVAEKPAFRSAFRRRRCLVLADGYYEWRKEGKNKQPFYIRMRDEGPFAFAGLWERWSPGANAEPLETCTLITTDANELTRPIHDRMPVILSPDDFATWIDPDLDDRDELLPLLRPYDSAAMRADPVSKHVNNAKHDDPECVQAAS
jgi:putative SOS response-associated peptidase YedK